MVTKTEIFKMYFSDVWDNMRHRCYLDLRNGLYALPGNIFSKYILKSM